MMRHQSVDETTVRSETSEGDDRSDHESAVQVSRRGALGVLAGGAVLAACSSGEKIADLGPGRVSGTGTTPVNSQTVAAKSGPMILEVELDDSERALNDELAVQFQAEPVGLRLDESLEVPQEPDDQTMGDPAADSGDESMGDSAADSREGSMGDPAVGSGEESMGDSKVMEVSVGDPKSELVEPTTPPSTTPPSTTPTTMAPPVVVPPTKPTTELPGTGSTELTAELVVNKLTFGPKPGLVAQVQNMGPAAFIEQQLSLATPDPKVAAKFIKPIHLTPKECRAQRLRNWWMPQYVTHANQYRTAASEHQLFEMMFHVWMDHFNVFLLDSAQYFIPIYQEQTIRPNAMGKFKDLLKAVAHSPAMLTYLNNDVNDASTPAGINENYGRELLELHTLGIDRNEKQIYNEQDVRSVATIMGGWSTEANHYRDFDNFGQFVYRSEFEHNGSDITILGGAWSTAGKRGKARGDSLLEFLASHPNTARNVALRLCRRFVSDNPSQDLVESAAKVFLESDTAIVPTLRHIFYSDEFAKSGGLKARRGAEIEAALLRIAGTNVTTSTYEGNDARSLRWYLKTARRHEPWQWQQPDGYPDDAEHWIRAGEMHNRWRDADHLGWGVRWSNRFESELYARVKSEPKAGALVRRIAAELALGAIPDEDVAVVLQKLEMAPDADTSSLSVRDVRTMMILLASHPRFQTR